MTQLDHYNSRRPHAASRTRRTAVAVAAVVAPILAASLLASGAGAATSASRPSATQPVKPDFSFYAGKTVTFYTGGSPGGANDELALIAAPLMASYLHCTINVVDIPAGATVPAQDTTAASTPNGLSFGQMGPIGNVENEVQNIPDVNFHMVQMEYIGGVSPAQYVIAATKASGIHTMTALIKSPTPVKFLALSGGGQLT